MKKQHIITLLFALGLLSVGQSAIAQIRLNQVGIGVSSWTRTYEGADETSLFIEGSQSSDFKPSSALPHVFVEVGIYKNLGLEARLGVWKNTFTGVSTLGSDIAVEETIVQRVTPVSLGLNYTFAIPNNSNFFIYTGLGLNKYYLQNEVSREVTGTEGTVNPVVYAGNNNGLYAKLALEYRFTEKLGLSVLGRYNSGQYNQNFQADADAETETREISLRGFEVGFALSYRLEDLFSKKSEEKVKED